MRVRPVVDQATPEGPHVRRYRLSDPERRTQIDLRCDEAGAEVVKSEFDPRASPAAFR
jgi:hypothetical protein